MNTLLLISVLAGIAVLLILVLKVRMQAFLALLIASIVSGLLAGMDGGQLVRTMQEGMASTLGFIATVVGLGAMFGAILEASGGAQAIARALISERKPGRTSWALMFTGFIISIPVFFDVALIILIPVLYGLQRRSGKSILAFAIPLLGGMAVTHAFVPPTPGPVAVADIIGADLGMVILIGIITGIPAAIIGGIFYGRFISGRIFVPAPEIQTETEQQNLPPFGLLMMLILIPLALILANSLVQIFSSETSTGLRSISSLLGHPFSALIIANLLAWYFLGLRRGFSRENLLRITTRSFVPIGIIILLCGGGGVFKQVLVDSGSGEMLATSMVAAGIPIILFAFIVSALVRLLQGSATVAMITGAGLTAPIVANLGLDPVQMACVVIAIASGGTFGSHVNDSGFWLVNQYLGLTEKQTFRSWTILSFIVGGTGLICAMIVYYLV